MLHILERCSEEISSHFAKTYTKICQIEITIELMNPMIRFHNRLKNCTEKLYEHLKASKCSKNQVMYMFVSGSKWKHLLRKRSKKIVQMSRRYIINTIHREGYQIRASKEYKLLSSTKIWVLFFRIMTTTNKTKSKHETYLSLMANSDVAVNRKHPPIFRLTMDRGRTVNDGIPVRRSFSPTSTSRKFWHLEKNDVSPRSTTLSWEKSEYLP